MKTNSEHTVSATRLKSMEYVRNVPNISLVVTIVLQQMNVQVVLIVQLHCLMENVVARKGLLTKECASFVMLIKPTHQAFARNVQS